VESGVDASVTQSGKNGKGHGLFQLTDPARKASFKQFNGGKDLDDSNADQQINPHFPDANGKIWQFWQYSVAISA
jgi:hypothetical protein